MFSSRMGFSPRIGLAAVALAAAIGLGGCTDGYGYNGVSLGYSSGGYGGYGGDYYDAAYYGGYGYGGGYGWYGDYYYPGAGYYVYDRNRRAHRWNDGQRRYWEGRRDRRWDGRNGRDNWQGFNRDNRPNRWGGPSLSRWPGCARAASNRTWRWWPHLSAGESWRPWRGAARQSARPAQLITISSGSGRR